MKYLILLLAGLFAFNTYSQTGTADNTALKFLTGLMFYEKQNDKSKLSSGYFIGMELEMPMGKGISFFKAYFVPELNYWTVEERNNLGLGVNFRGKFKAGGTRPYIDLGFTYNMFSSQGSQRSLGGINTGIGIDIPLAYSNMAIVFDLMARIHIVNSKGRGGISLTPGIRIAF
jgi:hypothetical protein